MSFIESSPPINKEARKATHAWIEDRYENAMERRREFIRLFETQSGLELNANRRDSFLDGTHPESLARANHGALKLLLEAWYERLGIQDAGWTRYNDKTTARACLKIREILEKGDEELGIPIEALQNREEWITKMASLKWWFFGLSVAFDFLSAHGIGATRFGSGQTRVEILNYTQANRCLYGSDHHASMLAWNEAETRMLPTRWPPMRPCGCYEYFLLMKTIANAQGIPSAGDERTQRATTERVIQDWLAANKEGEFEKNGWPKHAEAQNAATVMLGQEPFEVRFYKGNDEERGISLKAVRVEGPFGGLL